MSATKDPQPTRLREGYQASQGEKRGYQALDKGYQPNAVATGPLQPPQVGSNAVVPTPPAAVVSQATSSSKIDNK